MSEEQIGRDLQELRSRLECLEASSGSPACMCRRGTGIAKVGQRYYSAASIIPNTKPRIWHAEKYSSIPPLFNSLLGLPPDLKIERAESKSWPVIPETIIQNVHWSDGRIEEYFRLQNQLVTLTKFVDPTIGKEVGVATYEATVVASGKAKPDPNIYPNELDFILELQNAQGGFMVAVTDSFSVGCHDNKRFGQGGRFYPDLYDIAERFHFYFSGEIRLVSC